MSHSSKIKTAGNKISAFVKLKGGNSSKVDEGVLKSNKALEDNEGSEGYGDAADATVATFEAVMGSIDKFESGDPIEITIGVLDILAEVSQFAALTGPQGMIVAAVVGPVCTIISSLLGAGREEQVESDEDMLKRVITEALSVSKFQDLKDTSAGVTKELNERMSEVKIFLDTADQLGSRDRDRIVSDTYTYAGAEFLGKLKNHIQRDYVTDDHSVANRTAVLITAYASVVFVRCQYLYMLSSLIGGDPTAKSTALATMQIAEEQKAVSLELLRPYLNRPNDKNHVVYSKLFSQSSSALDLIQGLCGERSQGKLMAIYNTKQKNYLEVKKSDADRSEAKTSNQRKFHEIPSSKKFVVFGRSRYEIFSLDHAGFVYAAGYNPKDDSRRRVNGWKRGNQIREGYWQVSRGNSSLGSVFLKNTFWNEYMYAADYGSGGGENPVYTWRPGHAVNQGYWIFEDIYVSCYDYYNAATTLPA